MRSLKKIILVACLFSLPGFADSELQLGSKNPHMFDTPQAKLGTNEAGVGLKVGDHVPAFTIRSHEGALVSFDSLLNDAPLMVVFYRGGWCSYCNLQVRGITEAWPEFKKRKVTPVLISVDELEAATLAQKTYDIPFPVLSDPDLKALTAFKVGFKIDDETLKKYIAHGIKLDAWSRRDHNTIAFSSVFFVNKGGVVEWAHTTSDYTTRPSIEQLLSVIDGFK